MEHEIFVEGFVLQVEVTSFEEVLPTEYRNGSRELTFNVVSGIMYDGDGVPMDVCQMGLAVIAESDVYVPMIEKALWIEIDAIKRRQRRFAA